MKFPAESGLQILVYCRGLTVYAVYGLTTTGNLAPFTLGVGGQSESKEVRKWTIATEDPPTGEEWPNTPRREHRFQREYIEPTYVRNSRVLLPSFVGGGAREL